MIRLYVLTVWKTTFYEEIDMRLLAHIKTTRLPLRFRMKEILAWYKKLPQDQQAIVWMYAFAILLLGFVCGSLLMKIILEAIFGKL